MAERAVTDLGFGLGLRSQHYPAILEGTPDVDWFEIISENYMVDGGRPLAKLMAIRERYPMVMHGVSLSIGSTDPLNMDYLARLKALAARVEPAIVSDHLCWTGVAGLNMHDLLPLPLTEEALAHVAARVDQVQSFLGRELALENASTYVTFAQDAIPEWEFLAEIARRTGCRLLLDVNNIYVSAFNHDFRAIDYIDAIPREAVAYIHLAGHENNKTYIIDTHDHPVVGDVWQLYAHAIQRLGPVATMIERDDKIPPLEELVQELAHARKVAAAALKKQAQVA
ncbi:MNIO family bufferin maturase [Dongia deserti]|uniref:MNIO family bufferin maturase n=1 Tax=Dongia deserti TaxID=2268030 RepID=UPI000E653E6B|nr:DUF692 domain-containing protein [Dongia deserti]